MQRFIAEWTEVPEVKITNIWSVKYIIYFRRPKMMNTLIKPMLYIIYIMYMLKEKQW
jgi:hypothetical protein